jgi:predicted aminopeptidase
MGRSVRIVPLLAVLACGCSPLYAYRSTAGHLSLLWHKRSIAKTIADPATSPGRREKLKIALDVRLFAVSRLALSKSRDFASWTPVDGAVTWLVYACSTTSLKPITFLGYPYKGHFRRDLAEKEAATWTRKGFDAAIVPASAYNTPLPFADPLPSAVLEYGAGDLAELLIHEFAHGTLGGEESAAQWIGERGAEAFMTERFAAGSSEFAAWKDGRDASEKRAALFAALAAKLEACYAVKCGDRETLFAESGLTGTLNNAAVAAHHVYRGDPKKLDALFEASGRRWPEFIAALRRRR